MSIGRSAVRAIVAGIVAAVLAMFLCSTILLLFHPVSNAIWAVPRAAWLTYRVAFGLVIFGGAFGLIFLRRSPVSPSRLFLVGILAAIASPVTYICIDIWIESYNYRQWEKSVIAPQIRPGAREEEIVAKLGKPERVRAGPDPFDHNDCSAGKAVKWLDYIPPHSVGKGRTFALDASGRMVCESMTWFEVWT